MEDKKRLTALEARIKRLENAVRTHQPIPGPDGANIDLPIVTGAFAAILLNNIRSNQSSSRFPAEPIVPIIIGGSGSGAPNPNVENDDDADIVGNRIVDDFLAKQLQMFVAQTAVIPSGLARSTFTTQNGPIVVNSDIRFIYDTEINSMGKQFAYPIGSFGDNIAVDFTTDPNTFDSLNIINSYRVSVEGLYNLKLNIIIESAEPTVNYVAFMYVIRGSTISLSSVYNKLLPESGTIVQITNPAILLPGDIVGSFGTSLVADNVAITEPVIYGTGSYFSVIKISNTDA